MILSQKGWIRAASGHVPLDQEFKYKEGDGPAFILHAQTTDKLLLAASDGRFYTLGCDKLPGARGFGEPVRTMIDLESDATISAMMVHRPGGKAAARLQPRQGLCRRDGRSAGRNAQGPAGGQPKDGAELRRGPRNRAEHDHVACVGDNRKLVVFNLEELPMMTRGQGVQLQRYRDGGMADAITFVLDDGLSWPMGGGERTRTETDIWQWKVARGAAGRMPPQGFPKNNRFD